MWKEFVKGYSVSNSGEIRNDTNGRILKHQVDSKGFHRVMIGKKHYSIHRLVAIAYIPNPKNFPNVIFKDLDKENITTNNLQWSIEQNNYTVQCAKERKYKNIKIIEGMIRAINFNKNRSAKDLASMYKVSVSTIYAIRKGKNIKRFNASPEM